MLLSFGWRVRPCAHNMRACDDTYGKRIIDGWFTKRIVIKIRHYFYLLCGIRINFLFSSFSVLFDQQPNYNHWICSVLFFFAFNSLLQQLQLLAFDFALFLSLKLNYYVDRKKKICVQHTRTNTQLISLTLRTSNWWQLIFMTTCTNRKKMHQPMEFGWFFILWPKWKFEMVHSL